MRRVAVIAPLVAALVIVASSNDARAEGDFGFNSAPPRPPSDRHPTFLLPGPTIGIGSDLALGLEVSVYHYVHVPERPDADGFLRMLDPDWAYSSFGVGFFGRTEWVERRFDAQRRTHARVTLGGEVGYGDFGLELGVMYDGADRVHAPALGAQITPYYVPSFVLPFASFGLRLGAPLGSFHEGERPPWTLEFAIALKFPLRVDRPDHSALEWL